MAGTPVGAVHVNALLSNLGRLYHPSHFVADQVCPYLDVQHESDLYPVWTQGDWYGTDVDDLVADRAEPRFVDLTSTTAQYQVARRELGWDISDRERKNADDQLRLETNKQNLTLGRLLIRRELRVAALLQDSSITTTIGTDSVTGGLDSSMTAAATTKWDNAAQTLQGIATDVVKGRTKMRQAIGQAPNTIVIPAAVAEGMNKSLLYSTVQYTDGGSGSANQPLLTEAFPFLPPVLWGMKVIVGGEINNTAAEGLTEAYADIWGKAVRLLYVSPGPSIDTPSVAYTFRSEPLLTRQWRKEISRVDAYAIGQTISEAVVAPFAGYTITAAI